MDISFNIEDYKLNIRAACIIKHNNKVLFHKTDGMDYHCIIGGRIELGEKSEDTIKREIKEELGKEIEIKRYAATIENFFNLDGKRYHEYMFIYEAEFKDEKDKLFDGTLYNIEGKDYMKYYWLDLDKIDTYPIKPKVIKDILKEGKYPVHKINID